MKIVFYILLIAVSLSLIVLILLQARGTGVGSVFGGSGEVYRSRRGVEKILHNLTVALVISFALIAFSLIFIQ